mmetsp:Transcript_41222/g.78741  ORF Transcript_41222/g.78741 Transcript_41222/m.78741 type:complete len:218 (-) Transcript_41222:204-857(-)
MRQNVVPSRGQTVAAHASVVLRLVRGCAGGAHAHDDVSRGDVVVRNHIRPLHTAGHRGVHHHRAHQVAQVRSLSSCRHDVDAVVAQRSQHLLRAVDQRPQHLPGNEVLVATNGGGEKNVVHRSHTQEVIHVHDHRVLSNALPHRQVSSLFPVHVCQRRFCSRTICMHDIAIFLVTAQIIRNDLAERLREDALVNVFDCCVNILFGSRHSTRHIALVT